MDIKEWDFDTLPEHPFIVCASSRRSGKSVAIKHLTYKYFIKRKKYRKIWVCSPTAELTKDYHFIENDYVLDEFTEDFFDALIEDQKDILARDKNAKCETLLILDDIANSTDRKTIDLLGKVSAMGRHIKLSVCLAIQSFKREFSPLLRFNSDVVIMWKQHNYDNRVDIIKNWLSNGNDKQDALAIINDIPHEYRCLIIMNTKVSDRFEDYIFHYTFQDKIIPKDFKMYR